MTGASTNSEPGDGNAADATDGWIVLAEHWKLLIFAPLAAGIVALGIAFLLTPSFTARTTFLSPPQPQSAAVAALASLGSLGGAAGGALAGRTPGDQYVALMQSTTVFDRIIDRFKLIELYGVVYRVDARKLLDSRVHITLGRKDNIITVEVDDASPQRAADMANALVEELKRVTSRLAITEAQQRRLFFEKQLLETKTKLTQAQVALQGSGFTQGALKAEPKAAAEGYARLRAEVTAAEVRAQTLRGYLSANATELQQAQGALAALRTQLAKAEQTVDSGADTDYIGKYREFKYQETLFDLFSRQYELARVDESREGAVLQVIDAAAPPERKSKPYRSLIAVVTTLVTGLLIAMFLVLRMRVRAAERDPHKAAKLARLTAAWRRR